MINALLTYLLDISSTWVSANLLDSGGDGVRVYHQRIPQGHEYPAVVFNVLPIVPSYAKKGREAYDEAQVQFDIYHADDSEAAAIAANLRSILSGWAGSNDGTRWNYTTLDSEADGYNDPQTLSQKIQTYTFRRVI